MKRMFYHQRLNQRQFVGLVITAFAAGSLFSALLIQMS